MSSSGTRRPSKPKRQAAAADAKPANPKRKVALAVSPRATIEQRLGRLDDLGISPNPLVPMVIHTIERALNGYAEQDPSELDAQFARTLVGRGVETGRNASLRAALEAIVRNFNDLTPERKAKIVPPELADLDPARSLDDSTVQQALRRAVQTRVDDLRAPRVRAAEHSPEANAAVADHFGLHPAHPTPESPAASPAPGGPPPIPLAAPPPIHLVTKPPPFTIVAGPAIDHLDREVARPGDLIQIHGSDFPQDSSVVLSSATTGMQLRTVAAQFRSDRELAVRIPEDLEPLKATVRVAKPGAASEPPLLGNAEPLRVIPRIDALHPAGPYRSGQVVTIEGEGFTGGFFMGVTVDDVAVFRLRPEPDQQPTATLLAAIKPTAVTASSVTFQLPQGLGNVGYRIALNITVTKMVFSGPDQGVHTRRYTSNTMDIQAGDDVDTKIDSTAFTAQVERSEISEVIPAAPKPGSTVLLTATNVGSAAVVGNPLRRLDVAHNVTLVSADRSAELGRRAATVLVRSTAQNPLGQLEFTLPIDMAPGPYLMKLDTITSSIGGVAPPLLKPLEVAPCSFAIKFLTMRCEDESDPEGSGDELVTVWASVCDGFAATKNSRTYKGFTDGQTFPYDANDTIVFPPQGHTGQVKSALAVSTTLLEWDAEEIASAQSVLGMIRDAGGAVAGGATTAGFLPVAAIAAAAATVAEAISKIVALLDDGPDTLGQATFGMSASRLQVNTNNPERSFLMTTPELGTSDDSGRYMLSYQVVRTD